MISRSRFDAAHQEMSTAAQKVYAAVPIADFWTAPKIAAEMKRQGINVGIAHVAGCLDSLQHAGLVREQLRGHFSRTEIREAPVRKPTPAAENDQIIIKPPKEIMKPSPKKTPLEMLGDLSAQAVVLADMVKKFAGEIEIAAIEIQQLIETGDEETAKLRQLKSLLKSLD